MEAVVWEKWYYGELMQLICNYYSVSMHFIKASNDTLLCGALRVTTIFQVVMTYLHSLAMDFFSILAWCALVQTTPSCTAKSRFLVIDYNLPSQGQLCCDLIMYSEIPYVIQ